MVRIQEQTIQRIYAIVKEYGLSITEDKDKPFTPEKNKTVIFVTAHNKEETMAIHKQVEKEFPYEFNFYLYTPVSGYMSHLILGIERIQFPFGMV